MTIPLPSANVSIILDEADYEAVSAHGWCINGTGYVVASINDVVIYLSHFLLDVPDGMVIVHRNRNRLDFRRENLRVVTRSEAMQRQKKRAGASSKYKGVQRHKKSGRWWAMLWVGERRRYLHLGYFESEIAAAKAYDEAARIHYGDDAWVNFGGNNYDSV